MHIIILVRRHPLILVICSNSKIRDFGLQANRIDNNTHRRLHVDLKMSTHTCVSIYIYVYICIYVYIYIYIYIYI
jgi:hypothetical protein